MGIFNFPKQVEKLSGGMELWSTQWPDLESWRVRKSKNKLNEETVLNTRHKTTPLPSNGPCTEVFVKDYQWSGKRH